MRPPDGLGNSHPVAGRFVERRKGGETGVKSVQSIRGVETWDWVEQNPWVGKLLESVAAHFDFDAAHFQQQKGATNACIIEYNDGTTGAVLDSGCVPSGVDVGWTWAGEVGQSKPTIISMLGWAGPYDQYHASNAQPHWVTEMMVTKQVRRTTIVGIWVAFFQECQQ